MEKALNVDYPLKKRLDNLGLKKPNNPDSGSLSFFCTTNFEI